MRQLFHDQPHVQCLSHHITSFSFELLLQRSTIVGIYWVHGLGQIMDGKDFLSLHRSWRGHFGCTVPRPWSYTEESYFWCDEKVQT